MTFREFLDALCSVNGEQVSVITARTFLTEAIQSDNFDSILNGISDDVMKSYLRSERNISRKLADEIKVNYYKEYLEEYLEDLCYGTEKISQLCDAFRKYCPDINASNALELVVRQFEKMLDSAVRGKSATSSSKKKHSISKQDLHNIQAIIINLQHIMEKCMDDSIGLLAGAKESHDEWQDKFNQNYEKFFEKNIELSNYVVLYPELEVINTIFLLSRSINFTARYVNQTDGVYLKFDNQIDEYNDCLKQLLQLIHTP